MEISTTTSHATSDAKVTSHYWGYRELTADEVSAVAGGDIGDYADGGDRGYGAGPGGGNSGGGLSSNVAGPGLAAVGGMIATAAAGSVIGAIGVGIATVGAAISSVGNQPAGPKSDPGKGDGGYDALGNQTGTGIYNYVYFNDLSAGGDHGGSR